jgi:hypothetical protein
MLDMQYARVKGYRKDPTTNDIILMADAIDEQGKPILTSNNGVIADYNVEMRLNQDDLQKLIHSELPTEEKRIQDLLDRIHQSRLNRVLTIEKMDDALEDIKKNVAKDFNGCTGKMDVIKMSATYRTLLLASAQKRLLSKFSMQEESELSLQLTKIRQSKS